ncbi:MAG: tRNA (N(6)-L-threonylcarbamoyladenosine(37)-C(2))-methylthiotransferase MtaB [Desulfosarcinaceae bacterium]|nr:tRNA (N(6)-L-threonylcarbamoyladenosine(37)-C(2))-methylthiotransferase MtaB [Desulfosarcinaceae bacterium]
MDSAQKRGPAFRLITLGCKVNQCESDAIARHLEREGANHIAGRNTAAEPVEVCIVNTCTVTHKAAMQSRQAIRQAIRHHPGAQIIVTGCYAQMEPDVVAGIEGVTSVVGHLHKLELPQLLTAPKGASHALPRRQWSPAHTATTFAHLPTPAFGHRTRPFLRIQDGCDAFCTYCIVPHTRGPSRSMPAELVAEQLAALGAEGFHEVVLTGIHVGAYGQDLSPPTSLSELLTLLSTNAAVERLRLSSIEPAELTAEILATVVASQGRSRGRICPHFHIPLQSGDNEILRRMHRPYTGDLFEELIRTIHADLPLAAIGADTLIGFPGESDAAFEATYRRIEALPVTYLHVFPFSPRKGTPAYHYGERVPDAVVKARCRRMRELGDRKKRIFYDSLVGKRVSLLVEESADDGMSVYRGMTDNYVPVTVPCSGPPPAANTLVEVVIREVRSDLRVLAAPAN